MITLMRELYYVCTRKKRNGTINLNVINRIVKYLTTKNYNNDNGNNNNNKHFTIENHYNKQ